MQAGTHLYVMYWSRLPNLNNNRNDPIWRAAGIEQTWHNGIGCGARGIQNPFVKDLDHKELGKKTDWRSKCCAADNILRYFTSPTWAVFIYGWHNVYQNAQLVPILSRAAVRCRHARTHTHTHKHMISRRYTNLHRTLCLHAYIYIHKSCTCIYINIHLSIHIHVNISY